MGVSHSHAYEAERNNIISVKYSDIPDYLRESAFYKSLNDEDPEGVIEIPNNCFKSDSIIISPLDFGCHLHIFRFWGYETIPTHILDYCSQIDYAVWKRTAKEVLNKELFDLLGKTFIKEDDTNHQSNLRLSAIPQYMWPYWMQHHPPQSDRWAKFTTEAAADGALEVLKFLHLHGYAIDTETCSAAAKGGHLECLKFLHETSCPWDEYTCAEAAGKKHLDCLRYAHENSCSWDDRVTQHLCHNSSDLDIEWLRYVLEQGCPIHEYAYVNVIQADRFDWLVLLHEYNAPWNARTIATAVRKSNLQCIQYLYVHGCPWDVEVVPEATDVTVLTFLFERGCPYEDNLLATSRIWLLYNTRFMHCLTILQYLIEVQGMYMSEEGLLFEKALLCADYESVQYLVDQGCPWGTTQFRTDSMRRYVNTIAHAHHSGYKTTTTYDARLLLCLKYAVEHGWKYDRSIVNCVCEFRLSTCMEYFVDQQQISLRIVREETVIYYIPVFTYIAVFDET